MKRRKEARKEEDLSLQTPAPENRTNLCSYAKRIIKIGSKLKKWEPKSTSQLENSRPLVRTRVILLYKILKVMKTIKIFII